MSIIALYKAPASLESVVEADQVIIGIDDQGRLYSKDVSANVRIFSTGMTSEEVQDIIGNSFTNSSTVQALYDDANNTISFLVVQNGIQHQNLSGVGSNTHADIDLHIASTSNPHATTKTQVGLSNVPNVDATLRANHTGTQIATTISDFAVATLAVILTGISFVNGAAIVATDSILVAFGKAQAQINSIISSLAGKINTSSIGAANGVMGLGADQKCSLANLPNGYDHVNLANKGTNTHAQIDAHLVNSLNPHATTALQVGADPSGTAVTQVSNHVAVADPHTQYLNNTRGDARYSQLGHGHDNATTSVSGFMSASDKLKLDNVSAPIALATTENLTSSSNSVLTNMTELAFSCVNGKVYKFSGCIAYTSANINTGIRSTISCPGGDLTAIASTISAGDGTGARFDGIINSSGDVVQSTGVPTANSRNLLTLEGVFECTANGTFTPQFNSENNGTAIVVLSGSCLTVTEV